MMRMIGRTSFLAVAAAASLFCNHALAVNPNPLQNAYWRFEEGADGQRVSPRNADVVEDSINDNNLRAFQCDACGQPGNTPVDAAPTFRASPPPKPLKSGLANTLVMDFLPNQDLYADTQQINNGIIAPGGGFTVEAALFPFSLNTFQTIVAKEGRANEGDPDFYQDKLPTFAIKTTNTGMLTVQQFDTATNLVDVISLQPLSAQQWYYVAAVNNGSQLSLYLDSGSGYELQGSVPVNGALFQGRDYNNNASVDAADYVLWRKTNSDNPLSYNEWRDAFGKGPDWLRNWTVGRGEFSGSPADFFNGMIDEVRLSNTALDPSQFLFAPAGGGSSVPEPTAGILILIGTMLYGARRQQRTNG